MKVRLIVLYLDLTNCSEVHSITPIKLVFHVLVRLIDGLS